MTEKERKLLIATARMVHKLADGAGAPALRQELWNCIQDAHDEREQREKEDEAWRIERGIAVPRP